MTESLHTTAPKKRLSTVKHRKAMHDPLWVCMHLLMTCCIPSSTSCVVDFSWPLILKLQVRNAALVCSDMLTPLHPIEFCQVPQALKDRCCQWVMSETSDCSETFPGIKGQSPVNCRIFFSSGTCSPPPRDSKTKPDSHNPCTLTTQPFQVTKGNLNISPKARAKGLEAAPDSLLGIRLLGPILTPRCNSRSRLRCGTF